MTALSIIHGMEWAVFNFEEPAEIHTTKLIEKHAKKAFAFRKNPEHRLSRMQFEQGISFVDEHFHFVNVSKIKVTMQGILDKLKELVQRYGVDGVIINPWNFLEHHRGNGQSETEYISEQLTMLVNFLWQHRVHALLIAHPTKMQKDKRTGKYEVPTLYSINGSAHFYNKTHNGISVYRDVEAHRTEIYVQKVKWYWMGKVGWASYVFNTDIRQYTLLDTSYRQTDVTDLPGNYKPVELIDYSQSNTNKNEEPIIDQEETLPF
jgi:twinkle protein